MKIGIMQPYFLPYIGYWQLLNEVDQYVIYDDVNFIKGGWINRNRILVNKESKMLTLKLNKASSNKLINEIEILEDGIQIRQILKTIETFYRKAPYFQVIYPLLEKILKFNEPNLVKFIKNSFRIICEYLDIKTKLIMSSSLEKKNELKGQEKVINICKALKATEYYNAIGGQKLYSFDKFREEKIQLKFLKTKDIKYKQLDNEFISNLSVLDVLMFNSKEEVKKMLNSYSIIEN